MLILISLAVMLLGVIIAWMGVASYPDGKFKHFYPYGIVILIFGSVSVFVTSQLTH